MIQLNDYLYRGDTVFRILQNYIQDLKRDAEQTGNEIDDLHVQFLQKMEDLLQHNEFLTDQSQRIREFYSYMAKEYPFLAFTFKGRIKSLIRAEQKFNGYVVEQIFDYYKAHKKFPSMDTLKERMQVFRDLIAYRIVISLPQCQVKPGQIRDEAELDILYAIANVLPGFLEKRGFRPELSGSKTELSDRLAENVKPYYRDYIKSPSPYGYQSLHITFYDTRANCYIELQLRTKEMDDYAEIGPANHLGYEKRQEIERGRRDVIPLGECDYFDQAYERGIHLQNLELKDLQVNMFGAINNSLINDGCGLFRGRLITPFEHLSRFQNDMLD